MSVADVASSPLFDRDAAGYDALRRALVPCFDGFYGTALDLIRGWHGVRSVRVLDLGAGTGLFSSLILERFTVAALQLIDASPAMLDQARRRLGDREAVLRVDDLSASELGGPWDLIVSALAIHHLDHPAQQDLLCRIHAALAPGGLFVNAEQVLGPTPSLQAEYASRWLDAVRAAGVSEADIGKATERMMHDRCATVEDQLVWMRQAGLVDVDCSFKSWRFAVLSGKRRA